MELPVFGGVDRLMGSSEFGGFPVPPHVRDALAAEVREAMVDEVHGLRLVTHAVGQMCPP